MTSRETVSSKGRKSNINVNRNSCQTRKRKGRASTSTCSLEELSLEANELLESPAKEPRLDLEKRRSLRSYNGKRFLEANQVIYINETELCVNNRFGSVLKNGSPLPHLPWADPKDVWERMKNREQDYKKDFHYLKRHPSLQVRMRSILLDWLIEVCEVYRLHRETFHLAVDFVDRYLSYQSKIAKQRLQLIGVTSLFIASKIEEIYPPKITEFAYVTDGACTVEEITKQELLILQSLKWKLSPVTSNSWLKIYLQIASSKSSRPQRNKPETHFEFPRYPAIQLAQVSQLTDLCILDIQSLQFPNSVIAAASLYHIFPNLDISLVTGYQLKDLCKCIQWLVPFHEVVKDRKVNSIKQFDKIPFDDAHNIQVHNSGISLLDQVHERMRKASTMEAITRTSPIQYEGILTPPSSTKKDY
ncbi:G1/S-specific cyclin-E1-like [Rhopilema esculentum]|uniref:G1/S-specific cyclin-E1-like n=1 Tax=Rhopilema esculentum TaxID=499914 RepID=UPI0031D965B4